MYVLTADMRQRRILPIAPSAERSWIRTGRVPGKRHGFKRAPCARRIFVGSGTLLVGIGRLGRKREKNGQTIGLGEMDTKGCCYGGSCVFIFGCSASGRDGMGQGRHRGWRSVYRRV